eukprot:CAMPEP_0201551902 /NCGR_PEP_ID=MMETSP0173_2-20130828/12125_1 /ASSEMBLY_ACC=CAM_ASM_000268 /TAXON_ID=218659 /ORGANISM="Vexillifera sp., Strain DIVA3 564/2" /LENGTH=550 /DNA_ID=CAMNT_0047962267 /DNA_START=25 /DNA_END=1677 /DNA_ORIENTATION=+
MAFSQIQPGIILLREGTDSSQGTPQMISNINACCAVAEIVATTLGPRGMDKLIYQSGGATVVSNDGATVMNELDIVHPAAKTLVDIAKSQDAEVGDGTTSVVLLAAGLLKEAKLFLEDGIHSHVIIKGYRAACDVARSLIDSIKVDIDRPSNAGSSADASDTVASNFKDMLVKCAATAMNSKLLQHNREFFGQMAADAVLRLDDDMDLSMIGIKKETGGSLQNSMLVEGVAFKKCFSYAGFEQQPKKFTNPKIICLNIELELKAERDNAELRAQDPSEYQALVDAEWKIIYRKFDLMIDAGIQVVLSRLPIGDLATQYFADRGVFCAGRVGKDDLVRVCKATGARIQTSVEKLSNDMVGTCGLFEEKQVGKERYNFFTGCPKAQTATIILRGGGEQFIGEAERSFHDALMVVRRARKFHTIVAGGGAVEMEVSKHLNDAALKIKGKQQLMFQGFANALETIPRQLVSNAGFDSIELLNKLRHKHTQDDGCWWGVDIENEGITNTMDKFVWEPSIVKFNAITAATEAACMILSIDETVKNPKANDNMAAGQ